MASSGMRQRSSLDRDGASASTGEAAREEENGKTVAAPPPRGRPGWIGFLSAVAIAALVLRLATPKPRIFTSESLSQFDGASKELPIYLSILGSVFDVTSGRQHYGIGGSYHHFSGRDATRAFVSGNFTGDGLSDSVRGLSPIEVKRIGDWRGFYHRSYSYIGKLIGTYYDSNGKPTDELLRVEKRIKRGEELLKQQEAEEKKFPTCNSRWSQSEGGEVWCDSGYPRILSKPSPLPSQGSGESRCACFAEKQLNHPGLAVYPGCEARATVCKTS
ncbi:membrane-associated progesterone-binding protein 4 [Selaginella moellendorffii]|uniref:membrane-associated progesterone-binding protein 4 n=1 Tax=Selaginella moellendorffii TaxID=88036 RepID=UPI000D1C33AD|nr:membrane-associated progesterone-binding protein 4 [Selaginella moellendorffii]|eukprot:XP_002960491.2 membrane-associated progesterone-binding protein 4 [Selaginella moellendorffii]